MVHSHLVSGEWSFSSFGNRKIGPGVWDHRMLLRVVIVVVGMIGALCLPPAELLIGHD
jgi:hypothetical protein